MCFTGPYRRLRPHLRLLNATHSENIAFFQLCVALKRVQKHHSGCLVLESEVYMFMVH